MFGQTLSDCEEALSSFQGSIKDGTKQNGKPARITAEAQGCIRELHKEFHTKMSDDLNTSHLLTGAFREALKFANNTLKKLKVYFMFQWSLCLSLGLQI